MGKVKGGFTFWLTYWDVAQELTPAQQGQFYKAIADYMFTDTDPEDGLKGSVRIAFKAIKPNLKTSIRRAESGEAGGKQTRSKTEANAKQTENKTEANQKQYQDKDKDKYKGQFQNPEPPGVTQIPQAVRGELEGLGMLRRVK